MPDRAAGARECDVLTRYLIGAAPTPYVVDRYLALRPLVPALAPGQVRRIDRVLLRLARVAPWTARLGDAYGRFARPRGALRQVTILLLAVLECSPPSHVWLDSAAEGRPLGHWARLGLTLGGAVLWTVGAMLVLAPVHAVAALLPEPGPEARS